MLKKNEKRTLSSLRIAAVLFSLAIAFVFWHQQPITAFAQGTAKVAAESGKIREKASTDSTVLASVKKGDTLDVTASTTDSNGYTWYKVFVDQSSQGYIRSDLVTVEGDIPQEQVGSGSSNNSNNTAVTSQSGGNVTTVGSGGNVTTVGSGGNVTTLASAGEGADSSAQQAAAAGVSPSQVLTARVKEQVRVRAGAGTTYDVAGSAAGGTEVSVSGEAAGEGGLWYQISFNDGNKTVSGFIREDFLEVLQMVPEESAVEEPMAEEPVAEPTPVNEDYYLQYTANEEGVLEWYLFDNIQGTSVKLNELLSAVEQNTAADEAESKQLSTMKIIIIAMAVVLVLLVVAVTILLFKLRDSYEDYDGDEYEDEEEDEDEDEEEEEEDEEEEERPIRSSRLRFGRKEEKAPVPARREVRETLMERNTSSVSSKEAKKDSDEETNSWQSKDFLELDDDMEFEFLDL